MDIFKKAILIFIAAAFVLGVAFFMTMLSPRGTYDPSSVKNLPGSSNASEMLASANKYEADFLESIRLGGEPSATDLENLERAIALMRTYVSVTNSTDRQYFDKIKKMSATLQNIQGKEEYEELMFLSAKADDAFTSGDLILAVELYKKLYEGHQRINKIYSDSRYYDINNLAKAERMLGIVSVAPMAAELENIRKAAVEAIKNKRWAEAERFYRQAIDMQTAINRDYSSTTFASFPKVRELEVELESLQTAPMESDIDEALAVADKYEREGNYTSAAESFRVAFDKQKELNVNFGKSRYASAEKLEQINAKMVTALSRDLYSSIIEEKRRLDNLLRLGGDSEEIPTIAESLLFKCERMKEQYKNSRLLDDEMVLSLRYLGYLGKNIATISKVVNSQIIPIFGNSKTVMFKSEIPQSLYLLVMQENPSRSQDPQKPVETVSYANAEDFCRRLSWILARHVTLPKPSEFRMAIGSLKYVDLNAISWNASNSGLQTQRCASKDPNTLGFFDLLGNVAEYTMPESSYEKPGIIGGSSQTWPDALSEIPFTETEMLVRGDRMVGFRIVIRDE